MEVSLLVVVYHVGKNQMNYLSSLLMFPHNYYIQYFMLSLFNVDFCYFSKYRTTGGAGPLAALIGR